MSMARVFALSCWATVGILACSQGDGSVLLLDEADASTHSEALEPAALPASVAATEVVARLDAHLAKRTKAPTAVRSLTPETRASAPIQRAPVRLRNEGAFLQVDADAPPQMRRASVALPQRARDAFRIVDETTHVEAHVTLKGATDARAEVVEGHILYRQGFSGRADIVHRPSAVGTEDFLLFDEAPTGERLEYEVQLGEKVRGLRLVENVLELVDEGGAPRLRVAPPYVIDAEGNRHDAALSVEGCAVDSSRAAPWGREPVAAGASTCTVVVAWNERGVSYPAIVDPSWETTTSMATGRSSHAASLLSTGRVLIAGGQTGDYSYTNTAELYDPSSGTWAATGTMATSRSNLPAVQLDATTVMVSGGYSTVLFGSNNYWQSAELYDTTTGQWSTTGSMTTGRMSHRAVRLTSGKVLVVGGRNGSNSLTSAEIYDPTTKTFSSAGAMATPREEAEAVLLPDGRVLVIAGYNRSPQTYLSSTEIFNPATNTFSSAPSLSAARSDHRATLLSNGRVFVFGGRDSAGPLGSGATYDPASNSWSTIPASTARSMATATLLANGQVLVAGGGGPNTSYLKTTSLYDPATNTWVAGESMANSRRQHTATRLPSGDVLVVGGYDGSSDLTSVEIYRAPLLTCTVSAECPNGPCVDGYCCDSACNGGCGRCDLAGFEGSCRPIAAGSSGSPSCSPYVCTGTSTACPTSCTSDAHCVEGNVCSAGVCKPKAANGAACSSNGECISGVCSEGVCCDRACDGTCESCASGTCSFVVAGTPKAGCGYFVCNGESSDCPASCTSDGQCRSDAFCDAGVCRPKATNGTACGKGGDCQSGFCVDGVCCESACDGRCARCDREDARGTCVPVVGNPVGGRAACTNDGTVCGGSCDGTSFDCSSPSAGSICAGPSCVDGVARNEARCDGEGSCVLGEPRHCAPYACGDTDCKTTCESSGDCHPSADCVQTQCVGTLENGASCVADGECKSGHCADGVCCNTACDDPCAACNVAGHVGTCLAGGDTSAECQGGDDVPLGDWSLEEPGGCGCRVAGGERSGGSHTALGGLGLALAWTFRRRAVAKNAAGR